MTSQHEVAVPIWPSQQTLSQNSTSPFMYGEDYIVFFNHVAFLLACVMLRTVSPSFLQIPDFIFEAALTTYIIFFSISPSIHIQFFCLTTFLHKWSLQALPLFTISCSMFKTICNMMINVFNLGCLYCICVLNNFLDHAWNQHLKFQLCKHWQHL